MPWLPELWPGLQKLLYDAEPGLYPGKKGQWHQVSGSQLEHRKVKSTRSKGWDPPRCALAERGSNPSGDDYDKNPSSVLRRTNGVTLDWPSPSWRFSFSFSLLQLIHLSTLVPGQILWIPRSQTAQLWMSWSCCAGTGTSCDPGSAPACAPGPGGLRRSVSVGFQRERVLRGHSRWSGGDRTGSCVPSP